MSLKMIKISIYKNTFIIEDLCRKISAEKSWSITSVKNWQLSDRECISSAFDNDMATDSSICRSVLIRGTTGNMKFGKLVLSKASFGSNTSLLKDYNKMVLFILEEQRSVL